jgi:Na+/proline symporter
MLRIKMANISSTDTLSIIVRTLGLIVLLVGLYIGIKVIFEAWNLYQEPQRIERFADAIEHGSNLDALIASVATSKAIPKQIDSDSQAMKSKQTTPPLKVTYFLAWGIVVILLMVIGSLASAAIRTGGQLALYDLQVKRFANQLLKEAKSAKE